MMGVKICSGCYYGTQDPGCHTKQERAAKKEAVEQGQVCAICLCKLPIELKGKND